MTSRTTDRNRRWLTMLVVAAVMTTLSAESAASAGREHSSRGDDLLVTVDTRWAGCAHGGYYPIRIRAVNRGKARVFTFQFTPEATDGIPEVQRTLAIDQNATVEFSLSVPMVGIGSHGALHVIHEGQTLNLHSRRLQLSDVEPYGATRPSLLLISSQQIDCGPFEQAVNAHLAAIQGVHSAAVYSGAGVNYQVVSPTLLPDSWIDYSGLDVVAVDLPTLEALEAASRDAILEWVQCGGTLLVYEAVEPSGQTERLTEVLKLDDYDAVSPAWQPPRVPRPVLTDPAAVIDSEQRLSPAPEIGIAAESRPGDLDSAATGASRGESGPGAGPEQGEGPHPPFVHRRLLLGTVYAFRGNPFPGTVADWAWFLSDGGFEEKQWTERMGISSRLPDADFLQFLIPGVRGVPIYAFLVLITLFTLMIGPLNYYLLWKRKQLHLLVVTIPAIAFVTSFSLFAYSAVAHGFGVKSRMRSLTVLDQRARTAVATCRLALYAGLAPSRGLQFSPETAVLPIWPESERFRTGTVNWTAAQALDSGWLHSRTRTQFLTLTNRNERGRIEVGPSDGERLQVANGLEWDVEALMVANPGGSLYSGSDLPAGSTITLEPAGRNDRNAFAQLLERYPLSGPDVADSGYLSYFVEPLRSFRRRHDWQSNTAFSHSRMETELIQIRQDVLDGQLRGRTYVAVLKDNPNIETGVGSTNERAGYHVLVGYD